MEEKKKNNKIKWIVGGIILIIILLIIYIFSNASKEVNSKSVRQIQLGDMIILNEEDKQLLREKTEDYIKENLKSPSTAEFEEQFEYICDEENIIRVKGYVDSQNSFGAMIRSKFVCEYFVVDNLIDTLVYLKFNDTEVLDIKDTYIEEYKKQKKLEDVKSNGNELNQEKLDYIMNEFNNNEINDVARITKVVFNEDESIIEGQIIAKSSGSDSISKNYWIDFNICSIMDYIKDFNIVNKLKIKLVDKDKTVEIICDDNFVKNEWKENHQINLVKEIFGENYKEQ